MPNGGAIAGRLHVKQHANAVTEGTRHGNLHGAQEWHIVPAELARGVSRELTAQVGGEREDGADDVRGRKLVLPDELLKELGGGGADFRWIVGVNGRRAANRT